MDSSKPAQIYLTVVPNRSSKTLIPIITSVIKPGSVIISDEWKAYSGLSKKEEFKHLTVNHKLNFVNPVNSANTQRIESIWSTLKYKVKAMKGIYGSVLPSYLYEWMWRLNVQSKCAENIFELVALFYDE